MQIERVDFRPVTPRNAKALVEAATDSRHVYCDEGSLQHLPLFPPHPWCGPTMRYLDQSGHKARVYVEFKIAGQMFRRAGTEEMIGNFAVLFVNLCGKRVILAPKP